jgi:16S rRNA G1207 methylase RsmC
LPYEAALAGAFESAEVRSDAGGYKIFEARR